MLDLLSDLAKAHGPIVFAVAAVGYLLQRHANSDARMHRDMQNRLVELESDRVTKHDLERVADRLENVSTQIQDNQNVLLGLLNRR